MRKYTESKIVLLVVALLVSLGCSKERAASASNEQQSGQTSSTGQTPDQSTSATSSQTGQQAQVEGCVVKRQTDLYIQPAAGDQMKVNAGGQDVASHVGQNVRLTGKQGSSSASSTSGTSGQTGSSQAAGGGEEFLVTRVDVVAEECPPEIKAKIAAHEKESKQPK